MPSKTPQALLDTNPLHDVLMHKGPVKQLLGDASDTKMARLLADPDANFPRPIYIGRRPLWWRGEMLNWLATDAARTRSTARQGRPPKGLRSGEPSKPTALQARRATPVEARRKRNAQRAAS
jgi:hypothetical protein